MKFIKFIMLVGALLFISSSIYSCANARVAAGAGVDVNFGPHGPRLNPHLDVSVYNGGRL